MKCVRLYGGQDGQSHFEEMDTGQNSPLFSKMLSVDGVIFKNDPPGESVEWHTAPRQRYLITFSGSVDVRIGDGTVMTFREGDIFLAEDLKGQEHTIDPKDN
jgi:quercetin dioxygenase-like cupin family protein